MNKTLHGTVTVKLGDEEFVLLPTLKAVRAIESRFGGLRGASQTITALSIDGCAIILAAGAGLEGKDADAIPEKVWQAGVLGVASELNTYLIALYNPRGGDPGKEAAGGA
ncbi:hypothetical protein [Pseudomonas sp. URMO17WK12:I11]|uniref:hypothetical protein n=1 Tax=Pseudomonas sp. URMO17WK12:I11 TaxID=1283291 RepID=UPI00119E9E4A|nr:hypothetical protein [Pseudomonas sp. URMO17WK12:I11]